MVYRRFAVLLLGTKAVRFRRGSVGAVGSRKTLVAAVTVPPSPLRNSL